MPSDKPGRCSLCLEHFRKENSNCVTVLQMMEVGNETLESSAVERDLGASLDGKLNVSQQCP